MNLTRVTDKSGSRQAYLTTLSSVPFLLSLLFVLWAYLPMVTISVGIPVQDEAILFDPVYELAHHHRLSAPYVSPIWKGLDRAFWGHPTGNQYYMSLFYLMIDDGLLAVRVGALFLRIVLLLFFYYLVSKGILQPWPTLLAIVVFTLAKYPIVSVSRPDTLAGTALLAYLLSLSDSYRQMRSYILAVVTWSLAILCHPLALIVGGAAFMMQLGMILRHENNAARTLIPMLFLPILTLVLFGFLWLGPFALLGGLSDVMLVLNGFFWHASVGSSFLAWEHQSFHGLVRSIPQYFFLGIIVCPAVLLASSKFSRTDVLLAGTAIVGMLYIFVFTQSTVWYFVILAPIAVYLFSSWMTRWLDIYPAFTKAATALLGVICLITVHTSFLFKHPYAMFANGAAVYQRLQAVVDQYISQLEVKSALISPQFYHIMKPKIEKIVDVESVGQYRQADDMRNYDAVLLMDEHSGVFSRLSPSQILEFQKKFKIVYDSDGRDWIKSDSLSSLGRPINMPRFVVALSRKLSP